MSAPPMDYVEFSVSDIGKAKAFYTAVFGWSFTDYGPSYTSFVDNGLGGGFTTDRPPRPAGRVDAFAREACQALNVRRERRTPAVAE